MLYSLRHGDVRKLEPLPATKHTATTSFYSHDRDVAFRITYADGQGLSCAASLNRASSPFGGPTRLNPTGQPSTVIQGMDSCSTTCNCQHAAWQALSIGLPPCDSGQQPPAGVVLCWHRSPTQQLSPHRWGSQPSHLFPSSTQHWQQEAQQHQRHSTNCTHGERTPNKGAPTTQPCSSLSSFCAAGFAARNSQGRTWGRPPIPAMQVSVMRRALYSFSCPDSMARRGAGPGAVGMSSAVPGPSRECRCWRTSPRA